MTVVLVKVKVYVVDAYSSEAQELARATLEAAEPCSGVLDVVVEDVEVVA